MRRSDREVNDTKKIKQIISGCTCCRLSFNDEPAAYIVPMSFGYEWDSNGLILYFHSAAEGKKIELIKKSPFAGFEMDIEGKLQPAATPCGHSTAFKSVIGWGSISILNEAREKTAALERIMKHNTGQVGWEYPQTKLDSVCVFKLTVGQISCKEHL